MLLKKNFGQTKDASWWMLYKLSYNIIQKVQKLILQDHIFKNVNIDKLINCLPVKHSAVQSIIEKVVKSKRLIRLVFLTQSREDAVSSSKWTMRDGRALIPESWSNTHLPLFNITFYIDQILKSKRTSQAVDTTSVYW